MSIHKLTDQHRRVLTEKIGEMEKPAPYTCNNCGHKGTDVDLWSEDDEDLLRCPICKSPDWVFD